MDIIRDKIAEIQEHIRTCHPEQIANPGFLQIIYNEKKLDLLIQCCNEEWTFAYLDFKTGNIGVWTSFSQDIYTHLIRSAVFSDLKPIIPEQPGNINPITELEI